MVLVTYAAILLIASWVNLSLYALEIGLATEYFRRSSRPQLHKFGVATFLLLDTICTTAILVRAFFLALVAPCINPPQHSKESAATAIVITMSTFATASVCEIYLISLHYALTRNRIITAFLLTLVVVHLSFSYASAGLILGREDTPHPSDIAFKIGTVGASTTAGTDVIIAFVLCYKFLMMDRTSVSGSCAHSLIRRIIVIIITSGLIVATTTLVMLILLIKNHVAFPMFFFCQGRAYSLTILANFLFGIPRGPPTTETNTNQRAKNTQSAVVFRLETETDEDPSPTTSEALEMPTKAAGHPNSLNSGPTHANHRTIISLEEIPRVSVKSRPDD